jgi:hypothetical protein
MESRPSSRYLGIRIRQGLCEKIPNVDFLKKSCKLYINCKSQILIIDLLQFHS